MKLTRVKPQKVYEVWRDTPYGSSSMGLYKTKAAAKNHVKHWNAKCRLEADHAAIFERNVRVKFEPKD